MAFPSRNRCSMPRWTCLESFVFATKRSMRVCKYTRSCSRLTQVAQWSVLGGAGRSVITKGLGKDADRVMTDVGENSTIGGFVQCMSERRLYPLPPERNGRGFVNKQIVIDDDVVAELPGNVSFASIAASTAAKTWSRE